MIYNRNRKRKKAEKNKGKKRRTQIQMSAIEGQSSRVPNYILRSSSSPQGEIKKRRDSSFGGQRFYTSKSVSFWERRVNQSEFLLVEVR
jgi:hypothetical protein